MALTFITGHLWSNGDLANSTNLNNVVNAMTYSGTLEVAKGGTGATSVATALTSLGLFQTITENAATNTTQPGTLGADLVFTAGPTVSLTAGTWLVTGGCAARTSDTADSIWLRFYNNTDAAAFGYGPAVQEADVLTRHPLACSGTVTIASGTKVIYLKAFRLASSTLDLGATGVGVVSGSILAIRLY